MTAEPEGDIRDRAKEIAAGAANNSVTMEILAGEHGYIRKSYLQDGPAVTYLDGDRPAYVLRNDDRGIGIDGKRNVISPDDGYATVVLVTEERTLGIVGRRQGDAVVEVPHTAVGAVTAKTGFRRHRLACRTTRSTYHFWVDRGVGKDTVRGAAGYIDEHLPATPSGDGTVDRGEADDHHATWRGQRIDG